MNYSKSFFGKEIENLTFQDIVIFFIDEKEESNTIEFKSYSNTNESFDKKISGIIRSICALLNSEGGIVIWGAPKGVLSPEKKEKTFKGDLSPVQTLKSKDWIINKVSDSITPLPINIKVAILESTTNYIYVFEVKPSNYKPHQHNNTYWSRLDGQTKPAPHYLIDALFKKISFPNIEGYIKFDSISNNGRQYLLDISILIFNFSELQNEENVNYRLMCPEGIFKDSFISNNKNMYNFDGHELVFTNLIDVLHYGAPNYYSDTIVFDFNEIQNKFNNKVQLLLSFGGKSSPMKTSDYVLDFNKLDLNNSTSPNYLISKKEENVLYSDYTKSLGKSKEDILKDNLNR